MCCLPSCHPNGASLYDLVCYEPCGIANCICGCCCHFLVIWARWCHFLVIWGQLVVFLPLLVQQHCEPPSLLSLLASLHFHHILFYLALASFACK